MSLPSIREVALENKIDLGTARDEQNEFVLVEAMRRDLPLAVRYLHALAHRSIESGTHERGIEDPNSPLGKQLTRIFAGTVLRHLAQKHFCHGQELAFLNCCAPIAGDKKPPLTELMSLQIKVQDGTLASADC